jgi:23S rRNA (uracil1939-C5)-methyltransferase
MEVTIERILPGGLGLAHTEGQTVMVALAAPGDRLRVRVDRVKGSVAFASINEIIEPSIERVEPPCPYFGRCGGCDFQQLRYQAQLDAKAEIIKDCLRRIGKIEGLPHFHITAAPNEWHYRARAQWQYDAIHQQMGYFESGSHRVCDVAECAVLVPELQATLAQLRGQMIDDSIPEDARDFRAIVGDEGVSLATGVRSPPVREADERELTRSINGETYHLNAESFFQTNIDLVPQLIDAALGEFRGEHAIDLYSGVGLFTLPLARRFTHLIAVEGHEQAANFARINLTQAGLTNAKVVNANVAGWLEQQSLGGPTETMERNDLSALSEKQRQVAALQRPVDFLLLDPPRTGAESRVISGILNLKPKRLSYVSCDPATLARDLKKLIAGGYSLDSLAAFDMFPQTHHVETVVHLSA